MNSVVIVDDDGMVLDAMRRLLQSVPGLDVRTASGTDEATELVQQQRPDLVLSDWDMGNGDDGLDLAVVMRALGVRVVLMSGWLTEARQRLATEAGAVMLLGKPFSVRETVLALLGRVL
jgi:DNA-binding NtrC family response regulator